MFSKFQILLIVCLLFLSIEILVRRWVWHQIPSQISSVVVYGILLVNLIFIVTRKISKKGRITSNVA